MLKKIPKIITSELFKILMDMGHGNEICIANANFPAADFGKRIAEVTIDSIPELLEQILYFFPLDKTTNNPVILMEPLEDNWTEPDIWNQYRERIGNSDESGAFEDFKLLKRFDFYDRAKNCYAIVRTCEQVVYSNIILKKGVIL